MGCEARRFDAAVDAIYATALEPSRWPAALRTIAGCFDDVGVVILYHRDDGSLGTIISTNLSAAAQAEYEREWWRHDIRSFRGLERGFIGGRDAFTARDVVTPEEIETHPIYTQFLVPNGFGWFAAVTICPDPSRLVWISVQRAMRKPAFTNVANRWHRVGHRAASDRVPRAPYRFLRREISGQRHVIPRIDLFRRRRGACQSKRSRQYGCRFLSVRALDWDPPAFEEHQYGFLLRARMRLHRRAGFNCGHSQEGDLSPVPGSRGHEGRGWLAHPCER
jgi:hypothetical protein